MLYISIFCIFLSIFLFTYNKNLLSQKNRCLVFPQKCNVLKGKPVLFGIIEVKIPQKVLFLSYLLKRNFNNLNIFR